MCAEKTKDSRVVLLRSLSTAVVANVVLWILSIVALIFILQNSSSPKGLFVILAAGLAIGLTLLSIQQRLK